MAKVGTTSISESINLNHQGVHYFSNKRYKLAFFDYTFLYENKFSPDIRSSFYSILFRLKRRKVITLFRDPFPRNVSLMFEVLGHLISYRGFESKDSQLSNFKEVLDFYFDNYVRHNHPFLWFDEEFKLTTGIDVFEYPFDRDRGYTIIKQGRIEVLLMTLEKLNYNEDVIRNFIDDPNFVLNHKNDGRKKWYSDLYSDFKDRHFLNKKELSFYYDNDIVRHFYNEDQIEKFKDKWRQK
jgi:hypothetical protein